MNAAPTPDRRAGPSTQSPRSVADSHDSDTRTGDPEWTGEMAAFPSCPSPPLPDYELIRHLDSGGFGEVWLARDCVGIFRALKIIPKGRIGEAEFGGIRAYQVHAGGRPHLVDIRHVGETSEFYYYVMELADACCTSPTFDPGDYEPRTVKADLRRCGAYSLNDALSVTRQVLKGLAHLHRGNLLHRDIKPANIIFVGGVATLADIGLVCRESRPGPAAHTPAYAPDGGVVDRSGDLHCVGRVLYEMVSGVPADSYPEFPAHADAARRAAVRRVLPIVDRACDPIPGQRFQSAEEFSAALEGLAARPVRWTRRASALLVATTLVLAAAAVVVVLLTNAGRLAGVESVLAPAATSAATEMILEFKPDPNGEVYAVDADTLPLQAGDRLRLRVRLSPERFPLVAIISDGRVQIAYPRAEHVAAQHRVRELLLPLETHNWWELKPPDGTIAFVLLAADRPLADAGEVDQIVEQLGALGDFPVVAADTLIRVEGAAIRLLRGRPDRTRGIPDATETVASSEGFLCRLYATFSDRFPVVQAVAAPQRTAAAPTSQSSLGVAPRGERVADHGVRALTAARAKHVVDRITARPLYREAIDALCEAVDAAPDSPELHWRLVDACQGFIDTYAVQESDYALLARIRATHVTALEGLARLEPHSEDVLRALGTAYHELGWNFNILKDSLMACSWIEKSLDVRRDLAERHPQDPTLAREHRFELSAFSGMLRQNGRPLEANRAFDECLALLKQAFARGAPTIEEKREWAAAMTEQACSLRQSQPTTALESAHQATSYFLTVPRFHQHSIDAFEAHVSLLRDAGRSADAAGVESDGLAYLRRAAADELQNAYARLGLSDYVEFIFARRLEDQAPQSALTAIREAIALRDQLVAEHPANFSFRIVLARAYDAGARCAAATGDSELAAAYQRQAAAAGLVADQLRRTPEWQATQPASQPIWHSNDLGNSRRSCVGAKYLTCVGTQTPPLHPRTRS